VLHPRRDYEVAMEGKERGEAHARTIRLAGPIVILSPRLQNSIEQLLQMAMDSRSSR
jgi:hypothetical protein